LFNLIFAKQTQFSRVIIFEQWQTLSLRLCAYYFLQDCAEFGLKSDQIQAQLFQLIKSRAPSNDPAKTKQVDPSLAGFTSVERLAPEEEDSFKGGLSLSGAGLIRRVNDSSSSSPSPSSTPRRSALGLDVLADQKRREAAATPGRESMEVEYSHKGELLDDEDLKSRGKKRYREHRPETPSHPGGVNQEARDRIYDRQREQRHRGSSHSSSSSSRDRDDGREDRGSWRSGYTRDDLNRDKERESSSTPSRSSGSATPSSYRNPSPRVHSGRSDSSEVKRDLPGTLVDRTPRPGRDSTSTRSSTLTYSSSARGTPRRLPRQGEGGVDPEDVEFDREFYNAEEELVVDETTNPFLADDAQVREFETLLAAKKEGTRLPPGQHGNSGVNNEALQVGVKTTRSKRISARLHQIYEDANKWEEMQLLASGVMQRRSDVEMVEENNTPRVHLLIEDKKPPFLDGRITFTKMTDPVLPVKDITSDLYKLSRQGSRVLREAREQKDRVKNMKRFWELAGSKMGNLIGAKAEPKPGDEDDTMVTDEGDGK